MEKNFGTEAFVVMVHSPKSTVVGAYGEREVKREEPEEEGVDIENESSEQPLDATVNETPNSGDKRFKKTAAQLMVLRTAFDQDNCSPWKNSDRMNEIRASTGLSADSVRNWFQQERKNVAENAKEQEILRTAFQTNPTVPRKGSERMNDICAKTRLGPAAVREWFANRSKNKMNSSNVTVTKVKKSAAQLEILLTSFQEDPSTPWVNSERFVDLCDRTGLSVKTIRIWFKNQRQNLAIKEKMSKETVVAVPPTIGRMKRKRDCEAEREEEEDDRNPIKKQKISAQKGPKNLKTSHGVKSAESGIGGDSDAQVTGRFKKKDTGLVIENVVTSVENVEDVYAVDDVEAVEEVQDSEDNDIVWRRTNDDSRVSDVSPATPKLEPPVVDNNDYKRALNVLPAYPKTEPPVVDNHEYDNYADSVGTLESYLIPPAVDNNENDIYADIVSPLDSKVIPPAVLIACRDRANSDKRKPKQCALCLEDKPNDSIASIAEAAQLDARFGSNLTGFLKYGDCVLVCDHHLTDFYDLKNVVRPEPVSTVSPRPTKCTICGGERIASVSIVSLKEAANLDVFHGSRVFDALHFSFAVKVCRVHREDLDRYQKAINNPQL